MRAQRMCIATLAALGLATTGCESKSKEGAELQAHAPTQTQAQAKAQEGTPANSEAVPAAKANTKEPIFQVSLAGGDLVAPILFEGATGMSVTPMGPLIFSSHWNEDVLSQDGKHKLRAFNCQSPERKAGTFKGEDGSPLSCDFHLTSTTAPFKGQELAAGQELKWTASLDANGTFELLAYDKKGLKHAKVGPKASTGVSDSKKIFDLQAEFKLLK